MKEEEINRNGQDEQDESKAEKALLRFQISNPKSEISNLFILTISVHPC
jgi:hypothetical protein